MPLARRLLFLVLFATLPVPYYAVATGWAPPAWVCGLAVLTGFAAVDGGAITRILARVLAAEAAGLVLCTWLLARTVVRVADRRWPAAAGPVVLGVAAALVALALLATPYRSPLVGGGRPTGLPGLLG